MEGFERTATVVELIWRDFLAAAVASGALPPQALGYKLRSTPQVGTSGVKIHEGNSAPAGALVAGLGKSERCGERRGLK